VIAPKGNQWLSRFLPPGNSEKAWMIIGALANVIFIVSLGTGSHGLAIAGAINMGCASGFLWISQGISFQ
jgi:hypothetical protein